jgi:hypothetical protein
MPNDSLKRSLERALIKSLVKGGWDRDKAESVAQQIDFANSSKIIAELKSNGTITVLQALELRLAVGNLIDYTGSCNAGGPPVFPDQTTSCQNPYLIRVSGHLPFTIKIHLSSPYSANRNHIWRGRHCVHSRRPYRCKLCKS